MTAIRKIVSLVDNFLHMQVPDEFRGKEVEVIVFPVTSIFPDADEKKTYDFSDVAGKMKWTGDAVAEQRMLRDYGN